MIITYSLVVKMVQLYCLDGGKDDIYILNRSIGRIM